MASPVIELAGLRKAYAVGSDVEIEVLHGIDFTLHAGEFAALVGPSGSGKSTLLNAIGLLERPTAGTYRLGGRETTDLPEEALTDLRCRSIGFVFQFHHLLPAFSALENVLLPSLLANGRITTAARDTARGLLVAVGLADRMDFKPQRLSGGQQQRVAIARALALSPGLVLADEPTGNLDTHSSDEIFALLRRFNRREAIAFLIVTHDPRLAARCDRIIELVDGRISQDRPNLATPNPVENSP